MEGNETYKNLMEMGISPILAEAALKKTKSTDVSTLLDWVSQHENEEIQLKQWLQTVAKQPISSDKMEVEGQSITHLVNADLNAQVQSMGYSKNVSQKAIFLTGNNSVEAAVKWIDDHKADQDFEEELKMVGQPKSTLTEEEAKEKLKQLQTKIRETRAKKEAEAALEQEKNRMRYGKEMIEAKRQAEEMRLKKQMDIEKIERLRDEDHKRKLLLKMRRERCEKLGLPFNEEEAIKELGGHTNEVPKAVNLSKSDRVMVQLEQVKVGSFAYPEKAKSFFQLASIYLGNIIKNPTQPKYRKVNTTNNAYQTRVAGIFGGPEALLAIGFEPEGTFIVLNNQDIGELQDILKVLEKYISMY